MSDPEKVPGRFSALRQNKAAQIIAGTVAGILIILFAVILSALIFGAYGWGLFVLTPFVVGVTTGYLVNRAELQSYRRTAVYVLISAALGCFGLILFSLEGLICLILASPLAALVAILGGGLGRSFVLMRGENDGDGPLYCVALLPAMFAIDAAFPPSVTMLTSQSTVIAAPPSAVWQSLVSGEPIRLPPTLAGRLGLAYPLAGRIQGEGAGALRTGYFSTGQAHEKIIDWQQNRTLGFVVLSQPPAMDEMSPYQKVHAPHLDGYFETGKTRFELQQLRGGNTRLTIRAVHRLRIDPVAYWEPIARWAIRENTLRVLRDVKEKAEQKR